MIVCVCECVCVFVFMCVCVCVCVNTFVRSIIHFSLCLFSIKSPSPKSTGPGAYATDTASKKTTPSVPAFTMGARLPDSKGDAVPGPQYAVGNGDRATKPNLPAFSMSGRLKEPATAQSPGLDIVLAFCLLLFVYF